MARKDRPPRPMQQQSHDKLRAMFQAGKGRSKHKDKAEGTTAQYIYSVSTYETYKKQCDYFIKWMEKHHPEVHTLRKATPYAKEWLEARYATGNYSAYTMQLSAKAVGKLLGITPDSKYYWSPPIRHRSDIARSRGQTEYDNHFSVTNNAALINFARSTGLRRAGLASLRSDCLISATHIPSIQERIKAIPANQRTAAQQAMLECIPKTAIFENRPHYYIFVREKGGKWRLAPILGSSKVVQEVVDKIKMTPKGKKVWEYIPKAADIHSYRADYAIALYKLYARPTETLSRQDVYACRGDMKGKRLDRHAMKIVETALGHEKPHTFASHYAYKL